MESRHLTDRHPMGEASTAQEIAEHLLRIGAVSFAPDEPFRWASGLRSPVYCDNRLTISHPDVRRHIRDAFAHCVEHRRLGPDLIAGTATAGIPHAAWLADVLDLPMVYVRSKPKQHGKHSQIEGVLKPGQKTVVVEDLVSTGGSSRGVVEALQAAGADVRAVLAIFSYEFGAAVRTFEELDVPLYTLTGFDELFRAARERGVLTDTSVRRVIEWRADPEAWSSQYI